MRLPFFPLHTVLFPHLPLPIHCFEDRYRALASDVVADGSPYAGRFVVSMIMAGSDVGDDPAAEAVGTICEVRSAERFADGRWLLLVSGEQRARIEAVDRSGPYAVATSRPMDDPAGAGAAELVAGVQRALDAYLASVKQFVIHGASVGVHANEPGGMTASLDQILRPVVLPAEPVAASYAVAGILQVELSRKQRLLELPDAAGRIRAEIAMLHREIALLGDGDAPTAPASDFGYNPN